MTFYSQYLWCYEYQLVGRFGFFTVKETGQLIVKFYRFSLIFETRNNFSLVFRVSMGNGNRLPSGHPSARLRTVP